MKQIRATPYIVAIIAVIGLVLYVAQSWYFANSLDSIGDEGSYLYKGYMFARGDYYPFQEYTFWTNKSPLAFLIPGYIQLWFGPGLRVARYFSVIVSVLMLVGVWLTARRLAGAIWAAVAVWVFALASAQIAVYSEAVTQVLVACMMAWMFYFTLGEERSLWQLVVGSALSILMVMTRQNMIVVPALLVLYIFWQHGPKAGLWSLATCAVLFVGFHILYWPGILQIWAPWLPASLTPFLNSYRAVEGSAAANQELSSRLLSRSQSFVTGIHDNFFVFLGSLAALIFFPKPSRWKQTSRLKMAVFLGVLFLMLFLMHTWASLPTAYCVYCFSQYQMFYSTVGFFFLLVVFANGLSESRPRLALLGLVVLAFATILSLFHYQAWGDWLLDSIHLPRLNKILSGGGLSFVSLREFFTYNLALAGPEQKRVAALLGGVLAGLLWLVVLWALHHYWLRKRMVSLSLANTVLVCSLVAAVFSSSAIGSDTAGSACGSRYLTYYEQAGRNLAARVPPGSQVYWKASGNQLALMLYLNAIKIFPPQIHAGGGYAAGETNRLYRLGLYNKELDTQWRASADMLFIWEKFMTPEMRASLPSTHYQRVPYDMDGLAQCEDKLLVFRRIQ